MVHTVEFDAEQLGEGNWQGSELDIAPGNLWVPITLPEDVATRVAEVATQLAIM